VGFAEGLALRVTALGSNPVALRRPLSGRGMTLNGEGTVASAVASASATGDAEGVQEVLLTHGQQEYLWPGDTLNLVDENRCPATGVSARYAGNPCSYRCEAVTLEAVTREAVTRVPAEMAPTRRLAGSAKTTAEAAEEEAEAAEEDEAAEAAPPIAPRLPIDGRGRGGGERPGRRGREGGCGTGDCVSRGCT
jgi:hypothetical protein